MPRTVAQIEKDIKTNQASQDKLKTALKKLKEDLSKAKAAEKEKAKAAGAKKPAKKATAKKK
ncbi:MAG: hypothetical protein OEZ13_08245 [Spirochaetia bacterium]|nr:hypothetical protein [Spirochaetia bacterium]